MYLSVIVELCFERNKHVALNFSKFSDNISNRKVRKKVKKLDKKSRKSKKGVGVGIYTNWPIIQEFPQKVGNLTEKLKVSPSYSFLIKHSISAG